MKKTERYSYLLLADLQNDIPDEIHLTTSLCAWCKYADWSGTPCSDNCELNCLHPLNSDNFLWDFWNVWQGSDCWGFRPLYPQDACVDAVGIMLQGKYPDVSTMPLIGKKKRR